MAQESAVCSSRTYTGLEQRIVVLDGRERHFTVYLPEQYDGATRLPVLFSFHGFNSDIDEQIERTGFNALADHYGFIVIYPQGMGQPTQWYNGTSVLAPEDDLRDVKFMQAMLDTVDGLCADATRVYGTGFSAGGGMAYRIACEFSERIAAFGTMSGAFATIPNGCQPTRAMPLIALHGSDDPIVPLKGLGVFLPNIQDWLDTWRTINQCTSAAVTRDDALATVYEYGDCADNARIVFYTLKGLGHVWSGSQEPNLSGRYIGDISASETMWLFLSQFRLPQNA